MAGWLPLSPLQVGSPDLADTQQHEAQLAPRVPLPEGPFQSTQLVPDPAFASAHGEVPGADELTQANPSPVVQSRLRERSGGRMLLLMGTILGAVILLILLPLLAFQKFDSSPGPGKPVLPARTRVVPTRTGVIPALSVGVTPTLSSQRTPTSGVTPTPSPQTMPSPSPTPRPPPTSTPFPTPTPISTPKPTP